MLLDVEKEIFSGEIEKLKEEHKQCNNLYLKTVIKGEISVLYAIINER